MKELWMLAVLVVAQMNKSLYKSFIEYYFLLRCRIERTGYAA